MHSATYTVYLLLHTARGQVSVERATCPCAAGLVCQSQYISVDNNHCCYPCRQSASCVHVSAVLHALADLTPKCHFSED